MTLAPLAGAVLPLALGAAVLALVAPSRAVAERSELLLSALVLLTALGIAPRDLAALRSRARWVLARGEGRAKALTMVLWLHCHPRGPGANEGETAWR